MVPQVTVTTAVVKLLDEPEQAVVQNQGPSDLWVGTAGVTPAQGFMVAAGTAFEFAARPGNGIGRVYGVVTSGTADVRLLPVAGGLVDVVQAT
jgi:hypothetical protein